MFLELDKMIDKKPIEQNKNFLMVTPEKKQLHRNDESTRSPITFDNPKFESEDRFIPKRNFSDMSELFNLQDKDISVAKDVSNSSEIEQNSLIFESVLEQRLLNYDNFENKTILSTMTNDLFDDSSYTKSFKKNKKKTFSHVHTPIKKMNDKDYTVKRPKVLHFTSSKKPKQSDNSNIGLFDDYKIVENNLLKSIKNMRRIPKSAYKVQDAPGLIDDFYQDILDWSSKDIIAIAQANSIYFWTNRDVENNVAKISEALESSIYSSLKWNATGQYLAAGTSLGILEIFDNTTNVRTSSIKAHYNRIASMSWLNNNIFSTGSRDNTIITHDQRQKCPVSTQRKHDQEVCGQRWSPHDTYQASGGNDNIINIWDIRKESPVHSFHEHRAAVRALAWSPHQYGLQLSGGGNTDKSLKVWNVTQGTLVESIETESQVCNIAYSNHSNEFVTTHGFSGNQIMVWNGDSNERISVLEGHIFRVLHLAVSPNGENIATAAADETQKFWKVFPKEFKAETSNRHDFDNLFSIR